MRVGVQVGLFLLAGIFLRGGGEVWQVPCTNCRVGGGGRLEGEIIF